MPGNSASGWDTCWASVGSCSLGSSTSHWSVLYVYINMTVGQPHQEISAFCLFTSSIHPSLFFCIYRPWMIQVYFSLYALSPKKIHLPVLSPSIMAFIQKKNPKLKCEVQIILVSGVKFPSSNCRWLRVESHGRLELQQRHLFLVKMISNRSVIMDDILSNSRHKRYAYTGLFGLF